MTYPPRAGAQPIVLDNKAPVWLHDEAHRQVVPPATLSTDLDSRFHARALLLQDDQSPDRIARVGGIPYLLKNECDALLVSADDELAMANAVRRFLTEDGLAKRLSKNARLKVEQCDWSTILPHWERLFTEIAERNTHEG